MAKVVMQGTDELISQLQKLGDHSEGAIKQAVWEGAKIVADELAATIRSDHYINGDLLESMGISPMRNDDGYINVRIGFDGYDRNGTPNALKANALEHGTSKMEPHKFISPSVTRVKTAAIAAMSSKLDEVINNLTEE